MEREVESHEELAVRLKLERVEMENAIKIQSSQLEAKQSKTLPLRACPLCNEARSPLEMRTVPTCQHDLCEHCIVQKMSNALHVYAIPDGHMAHALPVECLPIKLCDFCPQHKFNVMPFFTEHIKRLTPPSQGVLSALCPSFVLESKTLPKPPDCHPPSVPVAYCNVTGMDERQFAFAHRLCCAFTPINCPFSAASTNFESKHVCKQEHQIVAGRSPEEFMQHLFEHLTKHCTAVYRFQFELAEESVEIGKFGELQWEHTLLRLKDWLGEQALMQADPSVYMFERGSVQPLQDFKLETGDLTVLEFWEQQEGEACPEWARDKHRDPETFADGWFHRFWRPGGNLLRVAGHFEVPKDPICVQCSVCRAWTGGLVP